MDGDEVRQMPASNVFSISVKPANTESMYMTVPTMGKMLGLKKTERYWLIHKKYFETIERDGHMYINRASFEEWYRNQVAYHKIDGEEPGADLKKISYSKADIAELLNVSVTTVNEIITRNHLETFMVNFKIRIPKEVFEEWYQGQSRYRMAADRKVALDQEQDSISMPEMAHLLGVEREVVYSLLSSKDYCHIFYTFTLNGRKRISKESFKRFLKSQDKYRLARDTGIPEIDNEANAQISNFRLQKAEKQNGRPNIGDDRYLTLEEAAAISGLAYKTVSRYALRKSFKTVRCRNILRIDRPDFEAWLVKRNTTEEA